MIGPLLIIVGVVLLVCSIIMLFIMRRELKRERDNDIKEIKLKAKKGKK